MLFELTTNFEHRFLIFKIVSVKSYDIPGESKKNLSVWQTAELKVCG